MFTSSFLSPPSSIPFHSLIPFTHSSIDPFHSSISLFNSTHTHMNRFGYSSLRNQLTRSFIPLLASFSGKEENEREKERGRREKRNSSPLQSFNTSINNSSLQLTFFHWSSWIFHSILIVVDSLFLFLSLSSLFILIFHLILYSFSSIDVYMKKIMFNLFPFILERIPLPSGFKKYGEKFTLQTGSDDDENRISGRKSGEERFERLEEKRKWKKEKRMKVRKIFQTLTKMGDHCIIIIIIIVTFHHSMSEKKEQEEERWR